MSHPTSPPAHTAQPNSTSTIVWSVDSEHIPAVATTLFDVSGVCVEACLTQVPQTLELIDQYKQTAPAITSPAFILSLVPKEKFAISTTAATTSIPSGAEVVITCTAKAAAGADGAGASHHIHLAETPATELWQSLNVGDTIHIGFDTIAMTITATDATTITGKVSSGGVLSPAMHLHLPLTAAYAVPAITDFMTNILPQVTAAGIHYLLLPGCLPTDTLQTLRQHIPEDDVASPWLVYRLDSESARRNLTAAMPYINGVMVARRELALTAEPDLIPVYTKEVIDLCRDYAKVTIVASQMLGSMEHNVTPTRAEVSDLANAVFDGADAIMLSDAVLKGPYAQDARQLAQKIIDDITDKSSSHKNKVWAMSEPDGEMDVICTQAAAAAIRVGAKALVCITKTGNTAIRLSTLDTKLPIVAITFDEMCAQKLRLLRGVHGLQLPTQPGIDDVLPRVNELLKQTGWLHKSDKVVFVTVTLSSMAKEASNLFTIQSIY